MEAVGLIKEVWDDKKDLMLGSNDDVVEVFDSFLVKNGDFIDDVRKRHCNKMKFKDFKELLLREVVEVQ